MADYTPTTDFVFVANPSYTPTTDFVFDDPDPIGNLSVTLDDAVGTFDAFSQEIVDPEGDLLATLDDASGSYIAQNAPQADLIATTDDVIALFDGYVAVRGDITATLGDVSANFIAENIQNKGIFQAVTLDDAVAGMIGNYDPNVNRFTTIQTISVREDTTNLPAVKTEFPRQQGTRIDRKVTDDQKDGTLLTIKTALRTENGIPTHIARCADLTDTIPVTNKTAFVREQATFVDIALCFDYEDGTFITLQHQTVLQQMTKIYPDKWAVNVQDSFNTQFDFLHAIYPDLNDGSEYNPQAVGVANFTFGSDNAYVPHGNFDFGSKPVAYNAIGHSIGVVRAGFNSEWNRATHLNDQKVCSIIEESRLPPRGKTPWIDLPPADPDPDPPSGVTIIVPVQEVYSMQNIITATLDDGTTAIQLGRVGLSDDADSSAWQFNADLLDPAEKPLVTQAGDGTPVTLYITINAEVWHVIVEKIITGRVFGQESVKLSGRGISALISKPYEQAVSTNFGSLQTVQQIADAMLPVGWTNTWSTVTWNVDAGAYSYSNKTPLEALSDLVKDIGAMIVPSRNSQVLEFKPRYPVPPWDFAGTAVDVAIADSAIVALTEEPVSSFQGDGVYVHGHAIGGELAFCRRNGTAGTKMIATISNPLMTDGVGIRAVAKRALAAQAPQPKLKSITTFMDGTIVPFINKGTLIGVTVDGVETKGIVNAVSIEANHTSVEQTLTIGESTPNTWVAFKEILPKDPLLVATMTSTDGQTSLMNLVDGGVVRVRGTGTATQKYYIRAGEIVSDAPALTQLPTIVIPV